MYRSISYFIFSSLLLLFTACSNDGVHKRAHKLHDWLQESNKSKVLCTTGMIESVVQAVGGEDIETMTLITGQLDPHSYALVKGDDEKLARPDLIFANGLGLEHGPSLKKILDTDRRTVELGDKIREQFPELIIDEKGQVDPHIWMDISLWALTTDFIKDALIELNPAQEAQFTARAAATKASMLKEHAQVKALLHQLPAERRYLVTSHDAFNYFARAYLATEEEKSYREWKPRFDAPEGLAPEGQISALDITKIIQHMKRYHISVLFPESNVSKDSLRKILDAADKEGLHFHIASTPLYGDAMGPEDSPAGNYLGMVHYDAQVIYENLSRSANGS